MREFSVGPFVSGPDNDKDAKLSGWVIVNGNFAEGIVLYGLFATEQDAIDFYVANDLGRADHRSACIITCMFAPDELTKMIKDENE